MQVEQIKEKFGGLRFYTKGYGSKEIRNIICEAENKSYTICESCGRPGKLNKKDWWVTVCKFCAFENMIKQYYFEMRFFLKNLLRSKKSAIPAQKIKNSS